jgi:hypothetical protein
VRLLTGATIGVGLAGVGMAFAGAGHGPLLPFLAIAGPVALLRPFAADAGAIGTVFSIVLLAGVPIEYGAYGGLTGRWRGRPDRAKRILALVAVHAACSALSIAQLYRGQLNQRRGVPAPTSVRKLAPARVRDLARTRVRKLARANVRGLAPTGRCP